MGRDQDDGQYDDDESQRIESDSRADCVNVVAIVTETETETEPGYQQLVELRDCGSNEEMTAEGDVLPSSRWMTFGVKKGTKRTAGKWRTEKGQVRLH